MRTVVPSDQGGNAAAPVPEVGDVTREIAVATGEFRVAAGACLLLTRGVGSCVVACLWDAGRKVGGMAHIPQPCSDSMKNAVASPGLFADTAVAGLLRLMQAKGARREHVSVRLVGAGNMFEGSDGGYMGDISKGILAGTEAAIGRLGLFVAAQSVGGRYGRSVCFAVATGLIAVRLTNGEQTLL